MSGERTEKATPKRRKDAREKGQVLRSSEITTAFSILCMFGVIKLFWDFIATQGRGMLSAIFTPGMLAVNEYSANDMSLVWLRGLSGFAMMLAPFIAVAIISGVAINILQVGFLFTTKPIMPKLSKISPLQGFKRIFSVRSLVEMLKSIAKLVLICVLIYQDAVSIGEKLPSLMRISTHGALLEILEIIVNVGFKIGIALLILGVLDYLYQWWRYEKDLRMSKQEIKEEYKLMEGDPKVKGKIRQKQREMGMLRMMQAIPEADVVITNPTHYAVALKYEDGKNTAPVVIAKGKDHVAKKIKQIAGEHKIEIIENKPVAQMLYAACEVGSEIPESLYQAVAEILAYVYRLKHSAAGGF